MRNLGHDSTLSSLVPKCSVHTPVVPALREPVHPGTALRRKTVGACTWSLTPCCEAVFGWEICPCFNADAIFYLLLQQTRFVSTDIWGPVSFFRIMPHLPPLVQLTPVLPPISRCTQLTLCFERPFCGFFKDPSQHWVFSHKTEPSSTQQHSPLGSPCLPGSLPGWYLRQPSPVFSHSWAISGQKETYILCPNQLGEWKSSPLQQHLFTPLSAKWSSSSLLPFWVSGMTQTSIHWDTCQIHWWFHWRPSP